MVVELPEPLNGLECVDLPLVLLPGTAAVVLEKPKGPRTTQGMEKGILEKMEQKKKKRELGTPLYIVCTMFCTTRWSSSSCCSSKVVLCLENISRQG